MSLLAVAVQFYAQPKIIASVSKNSFWPAPKVDSAIIKIKPRDPNDPNFHPNDPNKFFRVARAGFSHPRKQLTGNLSQGLKIAREEIESMLKKAGLKPTQRAETLSIQDWVKLTKNIKK